MGASSVTGVSGPGVTGQATTKELSRWAIGPQILMAGIATTNEAVGSPTSPPTTLGGTVTFSTPFPGLGEEYVVILTTLNGGNAYVYDMNDEDLDGDNEDDHFTSFSFIAESECDVMFIVIKVGIRA